MDVSTILTAVAINGVLLFAFQQWVQSRFRHIDLLESRDTRYREKALEQLIVSYERVWTALTDLESYLQRGLPTRLESTPDTRELEGPIRDAYTAIRQGMLFLPEGLCWRIDSLLHQVQTDYNAFLAVLRAANHEGVAGETSDPATMDRVRAAMNAIQTNFRVGLDDLRVLYHNASRELLRQPS